MRSCPVSPPCHDGNVSCRKLMFMPAFLPREIFHDKGLSKGQRNTQRSLQQFLRKGCQISQAHLIRNTGLRFLRRGILTICNNSSSPRVREGFIEIRARILSECSAYKGKERDFGKALAGPSYESCGGDGSGNGRGCGSGGSGWHWGSDWENGGDEGSNWFCQGQAWLFFVLGLCNKHPCGKVLISFLLLQLFLQRGLLANADAINSPLKPSPIADGNDSEASNKEAKVCNSQPEPDDGNDSEASNAEAKVCNSCKTRPESDAVFEVQGSTWTRLLIDTGKDEFIVDPVKESYQDAFGKDEHYRDSRAKSLHVRGLDWAIKWCSDFVKTVFLPEGYPESVTRDYLNYSLWRMGQNIASQINGVLTTQALLYAVGLGKGAIPTAAAINWVLKDGVGYLSKILLANYGRHFDVHPKGWRLLADLLENASYALELLTPIYPHLFVYLGAGAGAGKSAAGLIQAATRSCFYAGFAAQRNFAEVIAKGEAQGMVSKLLGIALGIAISASVGPSGPRLVGTFLMVTGIHMFCNLKSYQAVQLRTLNPYRACLVFGEYLRGGMVASVEEVNAAEPIFTEIPFFLLENKAHKENFGNSLSLQTKEDAANIASRLKLGDSFANVIRSQSEADRLFKIYQDEKYVLAERQNAYQALLKEGVTSHDLLKLILQVCYLHQLRTGPAEEDRDFYFSSPIEISYRLAVEKFDLVQKQLTSAGWSISDGLVARPLPYRLLNVSS